MTDIRRSPAADSRKRQKAAGFALMLAALLILPVKAGALELSLSGGAGNAGFTADGDFPSGIRPAFSLGIQSDISDNLSAGFFVRQDTLSGRTVAAEFSYTGGFLTLTAGPVFGLLNGSGEKTGQPLLLQPRLVGQGDVLIAQAVFICSQYGLHIYYSIIFALCAAFCAIVRVWTDKIFVLTRFCF